MAKNSRCLNELRTCGGAPSPRSAHIRFCAIVCWFKHVFFFVVVQYIYARPPSFFLPFFRLIRARCSCLVCIALDLDGAE